MIAKIIQKKGLIILPFVLVFSIFNIYFVNGELITVNTDMTDVEAYTAIESATAGDIVEIAPGIYKFRVMLMNHGTIENPIIIRAQDPNNRPIWDLEGKYCDMWPGSYNAGDKGRGAWQVQEGSHYIISDLIIRNSHISSGSSAGFRNNAGHDLTFRNCLFEKNDNGFTGNGENILYEFCEISESQGNGLGHSVYVFGGTITIRFSYIHDTINGQNLHIRAKNARIEYNLIENSGSYMADLMTNEDQNNNQPVNLTMTFLGNIFVDKEPSGNSGQVFVMYNDADYPNTRMRMNFYYNTYIGFNQNAGLIHFTNNSGHELEFQEVYFYNNLIYDNQIPIIVDELLATEGYYFESKNNWWSGTIDDYSQFTDYLDSSYFGLDPSFKDYDNNNFSLNLDSELIGIANPALGEIPEFEYYFENNVHMKFRNRDSNDIGAFESTTSGQIYGYGGNYEPLPCTPSTEICGNGIDEDCDGQDLICCTTKNELKTEIESFFDGDISIMIILNKIIAWKNC